MKWKWISRAGTAERETARIKQVSGGLCLIGLSCSPIALTLCAGLVAVSAPPPQVLTPLQPPFDETSSSTDFFSVCSNVFVCRRCTLVRSTRLPCLCAASLSTPNPDPLRRFSASLCLRFALPFHHFLRFCAELHLSLRLCRSERGPNPCVVSTSLR